MSTNKEPKHRGTLVCVVLKAKNLPNKRSIGKQDPYCVLQMGTEQQKTKPDKRGGQHPTWDEQLHFEIYDDMEDQLRKKKEESETIKQSTLSSATTAKRKDKAGKSLRVTCYADDNKEPEFIGEGVVDLTDTLRSGEFDEWVTIKAKDRYAGEVYLELTFYSSAAPPKPKKTPKPYVGANTTYGGAGTFSEDFDESEFAPRPPAKQTSGHAPIPSGFMRSSSTVNNGGGISSSTTSQSHLSSLSQPPPQHPLRGQSGSSMSSSKSHAQFGSIPGTESIPSSLRPSASMAQIDTYTPPYAPPHIQRERSPAPSSAISAPSQDELRRSDTYSTIGPSPSAQFYGHRLPDAAPSTIVAQKIQDDLRRHSQQMSASESYQHIPHSASISTIRPHDGGMDDLVGQMSSISMQQIPQTADAGGNGQTTQPSYHQTTTSSSSIQGVNQYPPYQAQSISYVQSVPAPGMPVSASVDQFGRPMMQHQLNAGQNSTQGGSEHSYAYVAAPVQHQYQPPSSPAPPSSAVYVTSPTYAELPISQSQHLNPSPSGVLRPSSPGAPPPPPPPRTHTPGGYHTLPTPPSGQIANHAPIHETSTAYPVQHYQQQTQSISPQYPPSQPIYAGYPQPSQSPNPASPPKPSGRPLPSTTPTPAPPLNNANPQAPPPPPQEGYYYGTPQPQSTWPQQNTNQQSQIPSHPIPSPSPQPGLQQQQQHQQQAQLPSQPSYPAMVSYPPPQQAQYVQAYNGQMIPQSHTGYVQPNVGITPSMSTSQIVHYPPPPPGPKPSEYSSHPSAGGHYAQHPTASQQGMAPQYPYHLPHAGQPLPPGHYQQQPPPQGIPSTPSQQFPSANQPQYYYNTSSPAPAPAPY